MTTTVEILDPVCAQEFDNKGAPHFVATCTVVVTVDGAATQRVARREVFAEMTPEEVRAMFAADVAD